MINLALVGGGFALGLASAPHCMLMCGAACGAIGGGSSHRTAALHAGRLLSYAAAGALAAASIETLGRWAQTMPALKPLWSALHAALLVFGLWLLVTAREPRWATRAATAVAMIGPRPAGNGSAAPSRQRLHGSLRAGALGLGWVLLPCALLQSALLMAALANGPAGGARVMAAFYAGSLPGLWLAPALWLRLVASGSGGAAGTGSADEAGGRRTVAPGARRIAIRLAGAVLAAASAWALLHGVWAEFIAWCLA